MAALIQSNYGRPQSQADGLEAHTVLLPTTVTFGPATATFAVTRVVVPLRKETMPPGGLGDPVGTWICVPYPSSCPNVG